MFLNSTVFEWLEISLIENLASSLGCFLLVKVLYKCKVLIVVFFLKCSSNSPLIPFYHNLFDINLDCQSLTSDKCWG